MDIFSLIYCFVLILFMAIVIVSLIDAKKTKISPTPTLPQVSKTAFRMLAQHTNKTHVNQIAELGCGWGGILLKLAKTYPNAHLIGYEMAFWGRLFTIMRTWSLRKNITITKQDFLSQDISDFDLIYCYLSPAHMKQLKPQLESTKSGTIIISNAFNIPDWEPLAVSHVGKFLKIPVFLYVVS